MYQGFDHRWKQILGTCTCSHKRCTDVRRLFSTLVMQLFDGYMYQCHFMSLLTIPVAVDVSTTEVLSDIGIAAMHSDTCNQSCF